MAEPATILITRPLRKDDPTEYTFQWGEEAVKIARDLGYNVIDIQKDNTTYKFVTEALQKYKPRLYTHFGHGCPSSLQGTTECIVTRKYTVGDLLCMAEDPSQHEILDRLMNPLKASCEYLCHLENEQCSPLCTYDTNIGELKGSIVYAVACHSASQLGICGIKYGVQSYIAFDDLLMFPVDQMKSQDLFGYVHITLFKSLLMGKSVREAEEDMIKLEDEYIRHYKTTKYMSLPMLWNKIHRKVLGDVDARIY